MIVMKKSMFCALFALGAVCFGDTVFQLDFPAKELKAQGKSMPLVDKIQIGPENFVDAGDGKFAFRLSDANAQKKVFPSYFAGNGFPYAAGSVEFSFKVLKQQTGSPVRFLHVFSPSKDQQGLLIFYFYQNSEKAFVTGIQVGKEQYRIVIPARLIKADAFNKVRVEWNAGTLTAYLDGKKYGDCALPAGFAEFAAKPRGWSTFNVLPVYPANGDKWENRAAVTDIKIESAAK